MFRYLLSDDECEWVMGNVERKTDRYERNTRIEDCAVAVYQFRGGARAHHPLRGDAGRYQGAHIFGDEGHDRPDHHRASLAEPRTAGAWQMHRPDGRFYQAGRAGRPL